MIEKYEVIVEYNKNGNIRSTTWKLNNKLHRTNNPAVEWADGSREWYVNGLLHRLDGPAVEYINIQEEYWIEGNYYSYEEWKRKVKELQGPSCDGKVVEIDGKKYQLTEVKND